MAILRRPRCLAVLFVLLSGADLALTCHLLQAGTGEVYEANWLAAEVLDHYGLVGLGLFKAGVVLLAGTLVYVVAAYRPALASRLLALACLAVGGVVLYSIALRGYLACDPSRQNLEALERESRLLDKAQRARTKFAWLLEQSVEALARGRCTLRDAVATLLALEADILRNRMAVHRNGLGGNSDAETLVVLVSYRALLALQEDGSPAARARAEEMLAACRVACGPQVYQDYLSFLCDQGFVLDREPENVVVVSLAGLPATDSSTVGPRRFDGRRGSFARRPGRFFR
jgi:hypothetical protein